MPSLYSVLGLLGRSTLLAMLMMTNGTQGQTESEHREPSLLAGDPEQVAAEPVVSLRSAKVEEEQNDDDDSSEENRSGDPVIVSGGGFGGMIVPRNLVWTEKAVVPRPTSRMAVEVTNALSQGLESPIACTLSQLPKAISAAAGIPVLLDERAAYFAGNHADDEIAFDDTDTPLQTALRQMLHPLGLKAVVEDEGLVITADPCSLVHKGIGVSRWVNIDEVAAKRIATKLSEETKIEMVDQPLDEAMVQIGAQHDLRIQIDRRALEEVGLSSEEPVSIMTENVKLGSLLAMTLRDFELTYTIQHETLVVTTHEAAEQSLLSRIYWLEGTGYAGGDFNPVINAIQTAITPDKWEALGGTSTIVTVGSIRPAIMISTTYRNHETISRFFETLRESHFGQEPLLESVQVPLPQGSGSFGGFGGGMGGGGMGGGGMF